MERRVRLRCFQQRKNEDNESFVGPSTLFNTIENRGLRQGFEKAGALSAVGHVINLLQEWRSQGAPIFLNAKQLQIISVNSLVIWELRLWRPTGS